jgi:hypothetical protein
MRGVSPEPFKEFGSAFDERRRKTIVGSPGAGQDELCREHDEPISHAMCRGSKPREVWIERLAPF